MVNDQAERLRQYMNNHKNKKSNPKTISIISGKGGVGKSNFAVNFAICLSSQNKKVLIFDLDIGMGNIDILLGLSPKYRLTSLFDNNLQLSDMIEVGPGQISYVASGTGLSYFFNLTNEKLQYFLNQLEIISEQYDYIIFDLGAGMSQEHIAFISASDECIVVTTPEPTAYMDAYSAMKYVVANIPNINMSLLLNNVQSTSEQIDITNKLKGVVRQFLNYDLHIFGVLPNDSIVTEAVKKQTPFYLLNDRAKISKNLMKITRDYINSQKEKSNEEQENFISKIKAIFFRKVE